MMFEWYSWIYDFVVLFDNENILLVFIYLKDLVMRISLKIILRYNNFFQLFNDRWHRKVPE